MTVTSPRTPAEIWTRARNIALSPTKEWGVIAEELATRRSIWVPYVLVLTALGPLAVVIGYAVAGFRTVEGPVWLLPISILVGWALTLLQLYLLAFVIEEAAQKFGGRPDRVQALKVAAYSSTLGYIGHAVGVIPYVGVILMLVCSVASLYSLFVGNYRLMKISQAQRVIATVCILGAAFFLTVLVFYVPMVLIGVIINILT